MKLPFSALHHRPIAAALLIAAAALVAYHNSFSGAFVFDDKGAILDNPTIRRLWPPTDMLSPPIAGLPVTGRPVTNASFALNFAVHGTHVFGYHAVNLAIHVFCALMLLGVVRRTLLQPSLRERFGAHALSLATAVALLWSVHPLQTAGVTYVSQRAESLASALILFSLYAFIRSTDAARTRGWLAAAVLSCWLAIGTKETAAAIPLFVALYDRIFFRASWRDVLRGRPLLYAALAASWLPLAWLVRSTENRGATWASDSGFTVWEYALIQCEAVVNYLRLVFWPAPLVFDYGRNLPVPSWWSALPHALLLIGLLAATLVALRRWLPSAFPAVCFFAVLAPTSSFLPIADAVFEHRMYLPSAAVVVFVVAGAFRWIGARAWIAVAPAAILLGWMTVQRNADYRSPLALWEDTVAKRPDNARARGNLGEELTRLSRYAEAIPHFETAYRLTPRLPIVPHNLAVALDLAGREAEAIRYYREALQIQPRNYLSRTNLANALAGQRALDEAFILYQQTVQEVPDFADARTGYGRALLRADRNADAVLQFRRAAELRPQDPAAHFNLGDALARAGRLPEAITALREAVRLRPDYSIALNNLGNALLLTRQILEAIVVFEDALRVQPDPVTHTNLGLALLVSRRREEAIAQFEAALRLDPAHAPARTALQRARSAPPQTER